MVDKHLYPFSSHFLERNGLRQHYLMEGAGDPVVMVHGNPTWSFYYRNLVFALRDRFRCIVPDHIGCGLSDKPPMTQYDYRLLSRIEDLDALLEHLEVRENVTLVVHDWGGMIGMAWASRYPERIKRLVILNTAAFHLPKSKRFPFALWLGRNTWLGAWLIRRLNLFAKSAANLGTKRKPVSKAIRQGYLAPYDSWDHRLAVLRFVQTIPLQPQDDGYDLVTEVESKLALFQQTPMLIGWGLQDFVFDQHFLNEWEQRFPNAQIHRYPDCGHYILEDAQEDLIPKIVQFLSE